MEGGSRFEKRDESEVPPIEDFNFELHNEKLKTEIARNAALARFALKPGHPEVYPLLDPKRGDGDDSNIGATTDNSVSGSNFVRELLEDPEYLGQLEQASQQVFGDE